MGFSFDKYRLKTFMARLLMLGGLAAFAGCATSGSDFSSDLKWLHTDKTTKNDVRMVLGDPQMVGSSSGTETWTYGYYRLKMIGTSNTRELKLYFNPDNTVKSYSYTSSFPEDRAASTKTSK